MVATEAALWGSVKAHGFLPDTVIVSDDAGQFNVGQHEIILPATWSRSGTGIIPSTRRWCGTGRPSP
jgi:hypothetical protein